MRSIALLFDQKVSSSDVSLKEKRASETVGCFSNICLPAKLDQTKPVAKGI